MPLLEQDFSETYSLLQSLVKSACVNPPGNELPSIKIIESFLKSKGIQNIQIFESAPNRANLFVQIDGSDPKANAILLGPAHVDVVPVSNPDDWSFDPFAGTIREGFIYGRGVYDMLFIVACQVICFCKVFTDKIPLHGDLMLLIVADEESGGKFGTNFFLKNHLNLFKPDQRSVYAITEGGGNVLFNKLLQLRVGERGSFWTRLSFKGIPGHGSFPYMTDNAVYKASQAAIRLYDYIHTSMPAELSNVRLFLKSLSECEPQIKSLLNEETFNENLKTYYGLNKKIARDLFSITHLTFSPNLFQGGSKINSIPGKAFLDVDIRTLPDQDEKYVLEHLRQALGPDLKPEITSLADKDDIQLGSMSPATPEESSFVAAIHEAVRLELPDIEVIPSIVGGGTDAKFCRSIGFDAYGFAIINPALKSEDIGPAHGIDEKLDLKSIDLTLKAYFNLITIFLAEK